MRVEYKHNAKPVERWAFAPGFPVHERFEAECVPGYLCDPRRCRRVHLPDVHHWITARWHGGSRDAG